MIATVELNMNDVVAVITDVFFQMRIVAAARAAGRSVQFSSSVAELAQMPLTGLILVDLDAELDVLAAIRSVERSPNTLIVAFGPHVDTERRKAARGAGADRVLAKSKFVTELPRLMTRDAGRPPG